MRTLTVTLLATALIGFSACSGEVTVGKTTVGKTTVGEADTQQPPEQASEPPTTPAGGPVVDSDLNPEPSTIGVVSLQLPLGWAPVDGSDMSAPGADSPMVGGNVVLSVDAEGRTTDEWKAAFLDGTTDLVEQTEGLEERPPITTASGLTLFHLVHTYSDNRAQLFATVVDDTLHLVRFGLDGTEESADVATRSAATLTVAAN